MIQKRILVAERVRRPPTNGWSWVDRGFLREHAERLSREAVLLYFFLAAAADRHGLSFYSDGSTATLLRLTVQAVVDARDELLAHDLVAYQAPLTQVLSLPRHSRRRQAAPGQGLLQLGDLFRQIVGPSPESPGIAHGRRSP
ncbi:MAG TPA: hypothetical protein VGX76_13820 [Pirellulales bacterium]|nr:hypothetical protein [Pirellulales bacterium]